jgi:hypothetical protein
VLDCSRMAGGRSRQVDSPHEISDGSGAGKGARRSLFPPCCLLLTRFWLLVAGFALLVAVESLLSSREDDTRSWGNFLVYFSHKLIQCHANLRGWGYIFIGLLANQAYAKMLVEDARKMLSYRC